MQLELYNAIKTHLTTNKTAIGLKTIGLWNNQFERENENVAIDYPCVFVEFTNVEYRDLTKGIQQYDMDVVFHLGFESYKNEDTAILTLKQTLHNYLQAKSFSTAPYETRLLRRSENQNFDHDNVQEYILTYHVSGKDFSISTLPTTEAEVDTLTLTTVLDIDNQIIRTGDGTFS